MREEGGGIYEVMRMCGRGTPLVATLPTYIQGYMLTYLLATPQRLIFQFLNDSLYSMCNLYTLW